jgi:hypothetical protein
MAALDLMAGVTVDLGHTAITDPLTAVVAVVALLVGGALASQHGLAGAAIGISHPRA